MTHTINDPRPMQGYTWSCFIITHSSCAAPVLWLPPSVYKEPYAGAIVREYCTQEKWRKKGSERVIPRRTRVFSAETSREGRGSN